jgi:hypothetical protein
VELRASSPLPATIKQFPALTKSRRRFSAIRTYQFVSAIGFVLRFRQAINDIHT